LENEKFFVLNQINDLNSYTFSGFLPQSTQSYRKVRKEFKKMRNKKNHSFAQMVLVFLAPIEGKILFFFSFKKRKDWNDSGISSLSKL
jgi:hypothetical protein